MKLVCMNLQQPLYDVPRSNPRKVSPTTAEQLLFYEDDAGDAEDAYAAYVADICATSAEADEKSARITAARACAGAGLSPSFHVVV